MNFALLVIVGFLAVSSYAAAGVTYGPEFDIKYNAEANGPMDSEDEYELGFGDETDEAYIRTTRTDTITEAPEVEKKPEVKTKTVTNTTEEVEVQKRSDESDVKNVTTNAVEENSETSPTETKSGLNLIPFPMSTILRLFGKNALKNFNIGSVCDTVQMLDWKAYQTLIENDDYEGLKEKLEDDFVLNSVTETIQESITKYTKMIIDAKNQGVFEKGLRDLIELLPLERSVKKINSFDVQRNVKDFIQNLVQEKNMNKDKDSLVSMENKMKMLLEVLQGAKALNSNNSNKIENFGSKGQNY